VLVHSKRYEEGIATLLYALEIAAGKPNVKCNVISDLVLATLKSKRYAEADSYAEMLIGSGLSSFGYFAFGYSKFVRGNLEEASVMFDKAGSDSASGISYKNWGYAISLGILNDKVKAFINGDKRQNIGQSHISEKALIPQQMDKPIIPEVLEAAVETPLIIEWNHNPYDRTCPRCQMAPCYCSDIDLDPAANDGW
jgi:hypothetical protein